MLKLNNKIYIAVLAVLVTISVSGQNGIGVFGNTYIHSNSEVGIHSKMYFNSGSGDNAGIVITNRNIDSPGMVSFMKSDAWENAADDRHIDGYCKIYSDDTFTFPIGNMGYFKPITISGAYGTSAAYTYGDAVLHYNTETVNMDSDLGSVSSSEYWILNGSNLTAVTLHCNDSSQLETFVGQNIENLRVVGWNGSSWEIIPAILDNSKSPDLNEGSITTVSEIVPDDYEIITFGSSIETVRTESEFGSIFKGESIDLTVFPNPTVSLTDLNLDYQVSGDNSEVRAVVIDAAGQMIYEQKLDEVKDIIQLPFINHTGGMYQIGIITNNGSKAFRTVIVSPE